MKTTNQPTEAPSLKGHWLPENDGPFEPGLKWFQEDDEALPSKRSATESK